MLGRAAGMGGAGGEAMTPIQHVQQAMREATGMQAARLGRALDALTRGPETANVSPLLELGIEMPSVLQQADAALGRLGYALSGLAESDDLVWNEHLVSVGDRAWNELYALAQAFPWLPDVLAFVGCCHIEGDAGARWANGNLLDDTQSVLTEYRGRS